MSRTDAERLQGDERPEDERFLPPQNPDSNGKGFQDQDRRPLCRVDRFPFLVHGCQVAREEVDRTGPRGEGVVVEVL